MQVAEIKQNSYNNIKYNHKMKNSFSRHISKQSNEQFQVFPDNNDLHVIIYIKHI